jgi:hypothetical protein
MSDSNEHQWEHGWEGHKRAQMLRLSRLTLIQKIQWLEEAHRTVQALERARATLPAATGRQSPL